MHRRVRKTPTAMFVAFTIVMLLLMTFPVYSLGNRVEPFVLGLPFSMFWVVFWIGVEFLVLIGFYLYEFGGSGGRDHA